jgi:plastocyanin
MIRRMLLIAGTVASLSVGGAWSAPASAGGGGCHTGVTQGTGEVVELVDACFTPTTLRVEPGDAVTFVNRDPMDHNVVANGWGHFDDLAPGERFSVSFDDRGIYPFACTLHPGMTGAIVVGDGGGPGNGAVVDVTLPQDPAPAAPTSDVTDDASPAGGWIAAGVAGLAIGLGAGLAIARSRRERAPAVIGA